MEEKETKQNAAEMLQEKLSSDSEGNADRASVDDLLKEVEAAAERGAKKGTRKGGRLHFYLIVAVIILLGILIVPKVTRLNSRLGTLFRFDEAVEGHDFTIKNWRFLGYKAADFEEAVLGETEKLKKIEVYQQDVSDIVTLTDTGLFNWSVFTKTKILTFNGTATYTVDLGKLTQGSVVLDEDNLVVTIYIPHTEQEINIPEDKIEFGDTEKGLLAFGSIKLEPEQSAEVQATVRNSMLEKLEEDNVSEVADRFARMVVWEMYNPVIKSFAKNYSLEIEFAD